MKAAKLLFIDVITAVFHFVPDEIEFHNFFSNVSIICTFTEMLKMIL